MLAAVLLLASTGLTDAIDGYLAVTPLRLTSHGLDPTEIRDRFDFRLDWVETKPSVTLRTVLSYAWAFKPHMMIRGEYAYVDAIGRGSGDFRLEYTWVAWERDGKRLAVILDTLWPTGSAATGTGTDSIVLMPQLAMAFPISRRFEIFAAAKYWHTLDGGTFAVRTRTVSLEATFVGRLPRDFFVAYRPELFFDTVRDDTSMNHGFIAGKMFNTHVGVFFEFTLGTGSNNLDDRLARGFDERFALWVEYLF